MTKKLIEVAIPLDKINEASAREKSIRHGHPSTLHLWWARRPLATARAVIFASLVDDPASRPDLYPTAEDQLRKRNELFDLIGELVQWENSNNEDVLRRARDEIMLSTGGCPPALLDPFAGGGTIPLEAQRLGLKAFASDLNPVAVMINKAMIELPARFKDRPPVNPEASSLLDESKTFRGAHGLASDVEYYGRRLKQLAAERIGHLYPTVETKDGEATVIAWIWARTVQCSNPMCGKIMPLVHSFQLSKKQSMYVEPFVEGDHFRYLIGVGPDVPEGTIRRGKAVCPACGGYVSPDHIKAEGRAGRMGADLMAIVAEGRKGRLYLDATDEHVRAADVEPPEDYPDAPLPDDTRAFFTPLYGLDTYSKLFTNRQLTILTTFSDLISDVREEALRDCGDEEYVNAIATYLAFAVDKLADLCNSLNRWENNAECPRQLFSRQAIPMVWDYAEANPFSNSSGSFKILIDNMVRMFDADVFNFDRELEGEALQHDASKRIPHESILISTDPPYYDNVPYADLSDFFYVWMRRSLRWIYPRLFMTMVTPKAPELISSPNRQGGSAAARDFFEDGMSVAIKNIYDAATTEYPITIYYAYKQDDMGKRDERMSKGWETMLTAIVDAGFIIDGTWPVRTEMMSRMRSHDSNALSTSIVIVCRKPAAPKPECDYNEFLRIIEHKLGPELAELQKTNLSPVDMAQAAIGPGMRFYSQYSNVIRADGLHMDVRSALRVINEVRESYLNGQDEGLDNASKFCAAIYGEVQLGDMKFGDAQVLATARNVSINQIQSMGVIEAVGGKVRLVSRDKLPEKPFNCMWAILQRLVFYRDSEEYGSKDCAELLLEYDKDPEPIKNLAYRAYNIADSKHQTEEALRYSDLVEAWDVIEFNMQQLRLRRAEVQMELDLPK